MCNTFTFLKPIISIAELPNAVKFLYYNSLNCFTFITSLRIIVTLFCLRQPYDAIHLAKVLSIKNYEL